MTAEINFLARQREMHESRTATDRKAFLAMTALVAVTAIIAGIGWYANLYFKRTTAATTRATDQIKQQITANERGEQEYLIFYEKLIRIHALLTERGDGAATLKDTYMLYASSPNVAIISSDYDTSTRELALNIGCNSVFCLQDVLTKTQKLALDIQNPTSGVTYHSLQATSLTRDNDGTYQLQITIGF